MLPPDVYLQARRSAAYHVQVELLNVPKEMPQLGRVRLSAKVVRAFRGGRQVRMGSRVSFEVSVCGPNADVPVGGTVWTDSGHLAAARFMEVFLDGNPPDLHIPLGESRIIDVPSRTPRMGVWDWEPSWKDTFVAVLPKSLRGRLGRRG
jgi:hypothetical protein